MHPDPSLSIETPERVALSLHIAGLGTRTLAYLVDALLLFLFWATLSFVSSFAIEVGLDQVAGLSTFVQAALVFGVFAVQWGYWVAFETLWSGQSPGKRALHIRVVRLDGSSVTFLDVALRSLGRVVDFLPALYAVGILTMVVNPLGRRLGDLLAGTVVVRERKIDLSRYGDGPVGSSKALSALRLTPAEFELVSGFLARAPQLDPSARARVALKVAEPFARRLSSEQQPTLASGESAEAFLATLVRRDA
jgi:uncharacterized RDD family membrane protein YckC